jgi:hypothetical protein
MAAKIYNFKSPAGFSFQEVGGYNIVPGEIIGLYYEKVRGIDVDPYIIKHYSDNGEITVIDDGIVIPMDDAEQEQLRDGTTSVVTTLLAHNCDPLELAKRKEKLSVATDMANVELIAERKTVNQRHTDAGYDIVTVDCGEGYLSCGWYDYSKTDRMGLEMAAFMLYATGIVNAEKHERLWEVCYKILPHSSELRDIANADTAIFEGLKKTIVSNLTPKQLEVEGDLW